MRRPLPQLHLITDDAVLRDPAFVEKARETLAAGARNAALHLRGPRHSGRRLFELAAELAPAARETGALLLVNDRVDVALAAGVDGVQLGARGLAAGAARQLVGPERMVGVSVRSREDAVAAAAGGADFLIVGTLYPSASHPGRPGAGPAILRRFADLGLPRVGIGGITPERVAAVRAAGAAGVAVLGGVWRAPEPAAAVVVYLDAWREAG